MSTALNPEKALIFRIVHIQNIDGVLKRGCLSRSSAAGSGYVEIGNQELIGKRNGRNVPCPPGGTLSDYVPFYFTPFTPMLYNIKTGRGVAKVSMSSIVILVSSLRHIAKLGLPFAFTDRHAYLRLAEFSNDLKDLDRIIWPTLQVRDFRRDDTEKFEKYQAEALVKDHVPVDALLGIICYDESVKAIVQRKARERNVTVDVHARPSWYL